MYQQTWMRRPDYLSLPFSFLSAKLQERQSFVAEPQSTEGLVFEQTIDVKSNEKWRRVLQMITLVSVVVSLLFTYIYITSHINNKDRLAMKVNHIVAIESNVSIGTLMINNHATISGNLPFIVNLSGDENLLTLSTPPFHDISCKVIFSQGETTCYQGVFSKEEEISSLNPTNAYPDIFMVFDSHNLPITQYFQLSQALYRSIDTTAIQVNVIKGQHLGTNTDKASSIAEGDGMAILTVSDMGLGNCSYGGQCVPYFDGNEQYKHSAVWFTYVTLSPQWTFLLDGRTTDSIALKPITISVPLSLASASFGQSVYANSSLLTFAQQLHDGLCADGYAQLAITVSDVNVQDLTEVFQPKTYVCLYDLLINKIDYRFTWQFGILLAANSNARLLAPALPYITNVDYAR